MAFYRQPIRPFDPVIEDEKDNQSSRYYRDSFENTGQDSRTNPPSQDQGDWELLTNIMPITRGGLDRRRGYTALATGLLSSPAHLYSFQRDSDLLRTIVVTEYGGAIAIRENGTSYNSLLFLSTNATRMVASRNYGYFFSGNSNDLKKWDGSASGGTSNWGINFLTTSVNANTSLIYAGKSANASPPLIGGGWSGTSDTPPDRAAGSPDGATAVATLGPGQRDTDPLLLQNYTGFSIPTAATILGISVVITGAQTTSPADGIQRYFTVSIRKFGTPVGTFGIIAVPNSGTIASYTIGSSSELWQAGWTPSDFNNGNVSLSVAGTTAGITPGNVVTNYKVDSVSLQVFYTALAQAISSAPGAPGAVTLTVGRIYYTIYLNSTTGHTSDLSPASGSTGPVTSKQINLTSIPVSVDPQVDSKVILATADGGDPSSLFQLAIIPNAQTTYIDNTAETILLLNQLWAFTDAFGNEFGVPANTPPPNGTICAKHKGRLWMAVGQSLFFSKSTAELTLPNGFIAGKYEEAWPRDTYLDISEGAETVSGLLSNGQALFIGTQRHIRWVTGDDPSNFSEPEIIHAEVGVLNQEVWQNVFIQGTPSGAIWLTPDFRVIGSDFNAYHDIGHPIQDVLKSINPAGVKNAHAMFVSDGELDLYILAIPTGTNVNACDTHCIFNMRSQKWVVWTPTNPSIAMLFNITAAGVPQWLFATTTANATLFQYLDGVLTDAGTTFTITARTSWLHLGAPTHRKLLDELELVGDPGIRVSVEGATPQSEFLGTEIHSYKSFVAPTIGPFKQQKVYLATSGAKDKYYRLTFTSNNNFPDGAFLRSYNLKSIPFNTL